MFFLELISSTQNSKGILKSHTRENFMFPMWRTADKMLKILSIDKKINVPIKYTLSHSAKK